MNAYAHHFAYEFKAGLRDRAMLLMYYLFPLMFYAMLGMIMPSINPFFSENMLPAMIVFAAMASAFLGLPSPLVTARESGVLRSYRINCIPREAIVAIPALAHVLHVSVVSALIYLTARPLFGGQMPQNGPMFLVVTVLMILSMASVGTLVGVVSLNTRMLMFFGQAIFLPSTIIGGLMFPSELLPNAFRHLSLLLPPAHAMNAFHGLAMGKETLFPASLSLAVLVIGGIVSAALALGLFCWDAREQKPLKSFWAAAAFLPYILAAVLSAAGSPG
jgi:ABC-2 type transport system permease protein